MKDNHRIRFSCVEVWLVCCRKFANRVVLLLSVALSLTAVSCENDIEKVRALTEETNYPLRQAYDIKLIYTDSTRLKALVEAKELYYYTHEDEPYYEFPAGFEVNLYDDAGEENYKITGNYGKLLTEQELWEGRGNVVVDNLKTGEVLNTEQLFWDQKKEYIYSNVFTKLTDESGVSHGDGFEAKQDMSMVRLKKGSGIIDVEE